MLNKSAPSTQRGAPAFSTRGTSQRILTHIGGFFLFKRHFSTNNLIDDHGVRKNIHLRQGRTFQQIPQKDLSPPSVLGANPTVTSILPKLSEIRQPKNLPPGAPSHHIWSLSTSQAPSNAWCLTIAARLRVIQAKLHQLMVFPIEICQVLIGCLGWMCGAQEATTLVSAVGSC